MIIFSDLHLRDDNSEVVIDEVLPGILEACIEHKETELACLGDLYHFRYRIDVRVQNQVREWLSKVLAHKIKVFILPGNHDQVDFAGRNALEVFGDTPGVRVFTDPAWTEHGLWIPYRKRPEDIATALRLQPPESIVNPNKVVYLHHGIQGAWMNNLIQDTEGLPQSMFAGWPRILCGHYHKRQELGPLTYIGSPWQTKADEGGQPKGYALWDGAKLKFVDTGWGPRYYNVHLTEGHNFDVSGYRPQDIVRVTTAPDLDPARVGDFLKANNVRGIVTPEVRVSEARISLPEGSSLDSYAEEFVKISGTALDKGTLLETFKELVHNT